MALDRMHTRVLRELVWKITEGDHEIASKLAKLLCSKSEDAQNQMAISHRVPWRSILGSILSDILQNYLDDWNKHIIKFAGDTKTWKTNRSTQSVSTYRDCDRLEDWATSRDTWKNLTGSCTVIRLENFVKKLKGIGFVQPKEEKIQVRYNHSLPRSKR